MIHAATLMGPFISTFSVPKIVPEIAAVEVVTALDTYVRSAQNLALGSTMFWIPPIGQVMAAFRTPSFTSDIFAASFGTAIETSFASIYTMYQINITVPFGLLVSLLMPVCAVPQLVPQIFAVELATQIDLFARSCIITASDPKLLMVPITGPII